MQAAEHDLSRLLLTIGQAVFEFEEFAKRAPRHILEIGIRPGLLVQAQVRALEAQIEKLVAFTLLTETKVSFYPCVQPYQTAAENFGKNIDAVCLFSGGVDSVSGTLASADAFTNVGAVFCSHLHQGRVIAITRNLAEKFLRGKGVSLFEVSAPTMPASGYSQSRGWLYILSAAAVAVWLGCSRIVVSECGPTMFQPKFSPLDQTTMTTHPYVISRIIEVLGIVAPKLRILTPFDNYTKAEVMAVCPEPRAFPKSHSCISQRLPLHDGTCFGCVVRRLAAITADIPDVEYANNPITDASASSGNLLSLLDFSVDFLSNPRSLPSYQSDIIFGHRKGPLFKRFALDNLAALYNLSNAGVPLAPAVERAYCDAKRILDSEQPLKERVVTLQWLKDHPNGLAFRPRRS